MNIKASKILELRVMPEQGTFIKIDRKIKSWEWYTDSNTKDVFLHCLLSANWSDGKYKGEDIPKGSFQTTVKDIAADLHMTTQQVRTALSHLQTTNEITIKTTNKFSIITINNWCLYQENNKQNNNQLTNKQQTNNKQTTNKKDEEERSKEEEELKRKEERKNNINNNNNPPLSPLGETENELEKKKSNADLTREYFNQNLPDYIFTDREIECIRDWIEYKIENKQYYKNRGMKSLLTLFSDHFKEYGEDAVIEVTEQSIANNYQGVTWNRIKEQAKKPQGINITRYTTLEDLEALEKHG